MAALTEYEVIELEPEEVIQFVTHDLSYIAYTRTGRRLDILKSHSVQPPIADPENFVTFMWLKALQGYFVLRQRYVEKVPEPWYVIQELRPETDFRFYEEFLDVVDDHVIGGRGPRDTESS